MANLRVIAEIKPAGDFPVVDAPNVSVPGGKRLDAALSESAAEVARKANKSDVDAQLAGKANTSDLAAKADKTYVDSEISKIPAVDISGKADKTYVDSELAYKADTSTVSALSGRVSDVETEQDALSARMDTFTNLPEGSTSGDAELADGRVGADGKTYTNIGGAIRGQVNDLDESQHEAESVNRWFTGVFSPYVFNDSIVNLPTQKEGNYVGTAGSPIIIKKNYFDAAGLGVETFWFDIPLVSGKTYIGYCEADLHGTESNVRLYSGSTLVYNIVSSQWQNHNAFEFVASPDTKLRIYVKNFLTIKSIYIAEKPETLTADFTKIYKEPIEEIIETNDKINDWKTSKYSPFVVNSNILDLIGQEAEAYSKNGLTIGKTDFKAEAIGNETYWFNVPLVSGKTYIGYIDCDGFDNNSYVRLFEGDSPLYTIYSNTWKNHSSFEFTAGENTRLSIYVQNYLTIKAFNIAEKPTALTADFTKLYKTPIDKEFEDKAKLYDWVVSKYTPFVFKSNIINLNAQKTDAYSIKNLEIGKTSLVAEAIGIQSLWFDISLTSGTTYMGFINCDNFGTESNIRLYNGDEPLYTIYGPTWKDHDSFEFTASSNTRLRIYIQNYLEIFDFYIMEKPNYDMATNNILYNKNYCACGDSFTQGAFSGETEDYIIHDGKYSGQKKVYPYLIGNRNNMNVTNLGIGGMTMCDIDGTFSNSFTHGSYPKYKQIPLDSDYITLKFGINDMNYNSPVGNIDDTTTTTFYGAWNTVLQYLVTTMPKARIGIIVSNGMGKNNTYVNASIEIAKKWGIPYLDEVNDEKVPLLHLADRPGISDYIYNLRDSQYRVSADNMHPNVKAHQLESEFVEQWLRGL